MLLQKRLTYLDFVKCHVSWLADFIKSDLIKFADLKKVYELEFGCLNLICQGSHGEGESGELHCPQEAAD